MKKILLATMVLAATLHAESMDKKIANMFILGFYGTKANKQSKIIKDICDRGLGGVLLFDRHPTRHKQAKNISSPSQLRALTRALSNHCPHQPLIAVDQEGGKVQRLKSRNGFYGKYPKASTVGSRGKSAAKSIYAKMANELHSVGINYNLAPVADMAVNKRNRVIYKLGRSYGSSDVNVMTYDKIFIDAMQRKNILTSLKHFPGHGSSLGDTHKGFVDVSKTWSENELDPFDLLIESGVVDSIMVAHIVFNKKEDKYPASLSKKAINGLLRGELGYNGVVISDDLQMYAISKHYSLRNTIKLAINAGVDILLFGNQLDPKHEVTIEKLVSVTKSLLLEKEISKASIEKANRRIDHMKRKIGLRP